MKKKQLVLNVVKRILNVPTPSNNNFHWCTNQITLLDTQFEGGLISTAAQLLDCNYSKAHIKPITFDAFLPGKYNCLFVFDESSKFSSFRHQTLDVYPTNLRVAFDIERYKDLCRSHSYQVDFLYTGKKSIDFNFSSGYCAKQALLDVMLDVRPVHYGLNPTFRMNEFDISNESEKKLVEDVEKALSVYFDFL